MLFIFATLKKVDYQSNIFVVNCTNQEFSCCNKETLGNRKTNFSPYYRTDIGTGYTGVPRFLDYLMLSIESKPIIDSQSDIKYTCICTTLKCSYNKCDRLSENLSSSHNHAF